VRSKNWCAELNVFCLATFTLVVYTLTTSLPQSFYTNRVRFTNACTALRSNHTGRFHLCCPPHSHRALLVPIVDQRETLRDAPRDIKPWDCKAGAQGRKTGIGRHTKGWSIGSTLKTDSNETAGLRLR